MRGWAQMIQSMTGFALASLPFEGGTLQLELKGVNSRFLDLHFKIADDLRQYEMGLRESLSAAVSRGKVECRLYYNLSHQQGAAHTLNEPLLNQLIGLQQAVLANIPTALPLSTAEILRWPRMLEDQNIDFSRLGPIVQQSVEAALQEFIACRAREGGKLAHVIRETVQQMRALLSQVEPLIPAAQAAYAEKLKQKLLDVLGSAEESRIQQEIAIYATRIDVAEELARLLTHLDEVERVLNKGASDGKTLGKRLDFLMQELNREANTLGSKSVLSEVSQAAMELKLRIEQMREQVQNLA